MKRAYISPAFHRLLMYLVKYRKIRGRANARLVIEQLILAYAKQLATGMPEKLWRDNLLILINSCEDEHERRYHDDLKKHHALKAKANSPGELSPVLRRAAKRKTYDPAILETEQKANKTQGEP